MPTLKQLERAAEAASEAHSEVSNEVSSLARDAAFKAEWKVRGEHKDRLDALAKTKRDARLAYEAARDAAAKHPWEGKRVRREVEVGRRFNRKTVEEFGVVEVRRADSEFPQGQSLGLPTMGEAFVRLEKKDGTTGLRFADLHRRDWSGGKPKQVLAWELVK